MNVRHQLAFSAILLAGIFSHTPATASEANGDETASLPRGEIIRIETDQPAPYAQLAVLASRSMHILDLARQVEDGTLSNETLQSVTIAPAEESWEVLLPETPREKYGVLVWVSPTARSNLQESWREILDKHGLIAISALQSGNNLPSLERRMPLALTGLYWATRHYPVDANRIYVGGFSGGSKIAQRLIFAFPDIFRGAILNAGYLEPGEEEVALPDTVLYRQLAQRPFTFVTGRRDRRVIPSMRDALGAFEKYCLREPLLLQLPQKAHQVIEADELADALAHMDSKSGNAGDSDACVNQLVAEAQAAASSASPGNAEELRELDVRFGGLIRSEILELREAGAN